MICTATVLKGKKIIFSFIIYSWGKINHCVSKDQRIKSEVVESSEILSGKILVSCLKKNVYWWGEKEKELTSQLAPGVRQTQMWETDASFWAMQEPNLEHIHAVSFQWHPHKVLLRNVDTSPKNETNSREGLTLKWDTTLDSSLSAFPPRSGLGDCVKSSHHGNWAGMSQSFR